MIYLDDFYPPAGWLLSPGCATTGWFLNTPLECDKPIASPVYFSSILCNIHLFSTFDIQEKMISILAFRDCGNMTCLSRPRGNELATHNGAGFPSPVAWNGNSVWRRVRIRDHEHPQQGGDWHPNSVFARLSIFFHSKP